MDTRLTIFKKGLLLIVSPLVIQAVFIGMLIQAQAEGARTQRWAVHTKEVMARVEEIYRSLLESYIGARNLHVYASPGMSQPPRHALEQIPWKIEELKALVSDNKPEQHRIDLLADQSRKLVDWITSAERLILTGEKAEALERLEEGTRLLGAVRGITDQVVGEEARLDLGRMERLTRSTARQVWIAVGGGVVMMGTTLVLALLFLNSVINRLAVLGENARNFAEGKVLEPPLTGRDEIAVVDPAPFHDMASRLDQQKQETTCSSTASPTTCVLRWSTCRDSAKS